MIFSVPPTPSEILHLGGLGGDIEFHKSFPEDKLRNLSAMMKEKGLLYVFRPNLSYFFLQKIVDDYKIDFFQFLVCSGRL